MNEHGALSFRNPKVQHLRRLIGRRRSRSEHGQFTFEGVTLLAEALAASFPVQAVFVDVDAAARHTELLDALPDSTQVLRLAPGVVDKVADTATPQGVIVMASRPTATLEAVADRAEGWVVVLDAIGDPGNAGTIVRTAEAFGARAVVFAGAGVDPFGPKTVRAAAGSAFRLPLVECDAASDAVRRLLDVGFTGYTAVVEGGEAPQSLDLTASVALVLGSEAHGVGPDVLALPVRHVTIPMAGAVESLNVASTAAVLGYERVRQLDAARPRQ